MGAVKILAADIGGTNARFAEIEIDGLSRVSLSEPLVFPTWSESIDSFDALLEHYSATKPAETAAIVASQYLAPPTAPPQTSPSS